MKKKRKKNSKRKSLGESSEERAGRGEKDRKKETSEAECIQSKKACYGAAIPSEAKNDIASGRERASGRESGEINRKQMRGSNGAEYIQREKACSEAAIPSQAHPIWASSCSMPVSLAAVKMKIVASATPAVPFSIRKARGRSGELGLWVYPGEVLRLLPTCFQRQGLARNGLTRLHNEWRVDFPLYYTWRYLQPTIRSPAYPLCSVLRYTTTDYPVCSTLSGDHMFNRLTPLLYLAILHPTICSALYGAILQPTL
jgi:hypothetical protein